jgi:hypothetical protein
METSPTNEQGVIVIFAEQAQSTGWEIVSIQTAFPDAIVRKDEVEYRAEFEYKAAAFKQHKHDIRKVDLIICWENNWPDCVLPVLALSEDGWENTLLDLPDRIMRELEYWRERALTAERCVDRVGNELVKERNRTQQSDGTPQQRRGTYSEFVAGQVLALSQNGGAGLNVVDVMAKYAVPQRTAYRWLKKYKEQHHE